MPGFFAKLPVWAWVLIAIVILYALYRYWKYRKSTAYAPRIVRGKDIDFTTPRDNPIVGGK